MFFCKKCGAISTLMIVLIVVIVVVAVVTVVAVAFNFWFRPFGRIVGWKSGYRRDGLQRFYDIV